MDADHHWTNKKTKNALNVLEPIVGIIVKLYLGVFNTLDNWFKPPVFEYKAINNPDAINMKHKNNRKSIRNLNLKLFINVKTINTPVNNRMVVVSSIFNI